MVNTIHVQEWVETAKLRLSSNIVLIYWCDSHYNTDYKLELIAMFTPEDKQLQFDEKDYMGDYWTIF